MHIGKPIKRTLASTSRPCFSLLAKQPPEVGIFQHRLNIFRRGLLSRTEMKNCPTLTMNQFTLCQHVSDSQAKACSLLCHQHQIVS